MALNRERCLQEKKIMKKNNHHYFFICNFGGIKMKEYRHLGTYALIIKEGKIILIKNMAGYMMVN